MNDTMDLLSWQPRTAPHSGPITSRLAAAEIVPHAETLRNQLLDVLKAHPEGLTDEEMQTLSGIHGDTQRPRRGELEKAGKIYKTLETRRTKSGRLAMVWKADTNSH